MTTVPATAQQGYVHGSDNVNASVTSGVTCLSGTTACYRVSISKPTPLYLVGIDDIRVNGTDPGLDACNDAGLELSFRNVSVGESF